MSFRPSGASFVISTEAKPSGEIFCRQNKNVSNKISRLRLRRQPPTSHATLATLSLFVARNDKGRLGLAGGEIVLGVQGGAATHAGGTDGLAIGAVDAVAGGEYAGGGGAG